MGKRSAGEGYDQLFVFVLVCLRAVGGEVGATSSLAPKIGPLGLVRAVFLGSSGMSSRLTSSRPRKLVMT